MIQTYHYGRFELFVIVTVIAIIALAAISRYSLMAEDARILRLEIISHHFMTGAANARIQYLVSNNLDKDHSQKLIQLAGQPIYFSSQGWPASITEPVANDGKPTDEDCFQLWRLLLQNSAPITKGAASKSRREYRVFSKIDACRYGLTKGSAYFDYYPATGRLLFIPDGNKASNVN